MPTLNTPQALLQAGPIAANTWTRTDGIKATGDITYAEATYEVPATGGPATADILRIIELPANVILLPSLCKIVCSAMGTAFNIAKVGDLSVDGITTADDDDRYSGAVNITAGGAFDLAYGARPAGLAGFTTTKEMWLTATLGTVTTATVGAKIRFVVAYATPS